MKAYWDNYVRVLKKYAVFEGTTSRRDFWMYVLTTLVFGFLASIISPTFGALYALFTLLPNLAVGSRRLHDAGQSGGWLLLGLIPVIGTIILIVMLLQPAKKK